MQSEHYMENMGKPGCFFCDEPSQPEHASCCNEHKKPLCCGHFNRAHFVSVENLCTPEGHNREAVKA